ncbi:hypothetical protein OPU71_07695 [Niveibacterium sp. 24ML]|uniref:hypothetical protein n=1 Tax=Niveibacterium sp. 24ML TaxID=2985512 RepID=UPI00226E0F7C|nr:hypothetical protein [Niveibacterium sp. 24ML]MCX9156008.1 hypothetical protein [Niveibacterium sp. 24ML]
MHSRYLSCILLAGLAAIPAAHALEIGLADAGELRLNGFATLAATRALTDDAADYRSANYLSAGSERTRHWDTQNDSILGLQAFLTAPQSRFAAVVQGVLANDTHDALALRMDWLYLDWRAADTLTMRAGRTPFPAMMDSESRWLGHSRLTVTAAPETYFHMPTTSLDGASLRWRHDRDRHYLQLRAGAGVTRFETASRTGVAEVDLNRTLAASLEVGNAVWRAYLGAFSADARVQSPPLATLNGALSALAPTVPEAGTMAAAYPTGWFPISQLSLGFEYLDAPWTFKAEAVRRSSDNLLVYAVRGWYAVAGYTLGNFTPYVSGGVQWQASDLSPRFLPPGTPGGEALSAIYNATLIGLAQSRIGAGLRYDLPFGAAIKLQYDRLKLQESNSRGMFVNATAAFIGRAEPINVFSFALDYQF